jgi:hypothetical protein
LQAENRHCARKRKGDVQESCPARPHQTLFNT